MTRGDDGMVTAFVVALTLALLFAAGLAYDAGRMVDARLAAADVAAGAARAGAQQTAVDAQGRIRLDPAAAAHAAREFAAGGPYIVDVQTEDGTVTVTVRRSLDLTLLRLFGLEHKNVRAAHSATVVEG